MGAARSVRARRGRAQFNARSQFRGQSLGIGSPLRRFTNLLISASDLRCSSVISTEVEKSLIVSFLLAWALCWRDGAPAEWAERPMRADKITD